MTEEQSKVIADNIKDMLRKEDDTVVDCQYLHDRIQGKMTPCDFSKEWWEKCSGKKQ